MRKLTHLVLLLIASAQTFCQDGTCGENGSDADVLMQLKSVAGASLRAGQALDVQGIRDAAGVNDVAHGSPAQTISDFCNSTGLASMHGSMANGGSQAHQQLEEKVMESVTEQMTSNNVDKVARDMFTMYICVRWVPDNVFWKIARQELANELLDAVVDENHAVEQAIAELYQAYKFVPMLCSDNLNVFDQTDPTDHTYFRYFAGKVSQLTNWMSQHGGDEVFKRLQSVDEIFCGSSNMNDPNCNSRQGFDEFMNSATSVFGSWGWNAKSRTDKWQAMADIFEQFGMSAPGASSAWQSSMAAWKNVFPYHSFVSKQEGMPSSSSPSSSQRYLVCFGKRVASEMHRRPSGRFILTDQNNLGCHGFWDTTEVVSMLQRTLELWKPPTCQMAEMTYTLKKKMLMMYAQMSEKLFNALPSMVHDEQLSEDGTLEDALKGPDPLDPSKVNLDGEMFVDGMRVKAAIDVLDPSGCSESVFSGNQCRYVASEGSYGTVANKDGRVAVKWDDDADQQKVFIQSADSLAMVPRDWQAAKGLASKTWDLVSGIGSGISSAAQSLVDSLYSPRQTSLGKLFSGSTSKWVVCPIKNDVNTKLLDASLGVEDAAFQDMQKEAYAAWTGYKASLPGEKCVAPTFSTYSFPRSQMCEISELHADHLERYTLPNGQLEQFLCPIKTSLPAPEQLDVLLKKEGQCFLHMTNQQIRQNGWVYNGNFPARKQYDRKPNLPKVEYELIKLLKVPGSGEVSYARTCSPEELMLSARFCRPMQLHNKWSTAESMAETIASAAVGSVGMGAASITSAVANYGSVLAQNASLGTKASDAAQMVGEQIWDSLTGAGRLLSNSASNAVKSVSYGLPGSGQREERLEKTIFSTSEPGLLLHALSFQESIGKSYHTSNSKERYRRYVVTMPCEGFEPAVEFSVKKIWSAVLLKMVASAVRNQVDLLSKPVVELAMRGESRYFYHDNSKASDAEWEVSGASLALSGVSGGSRPQSAQCETVWSWGIPDCKDDAYHAKHCEMWRIAMECRPKTQVSSGRGSWFSSPFKVSSSGWWRADDPTLISTVTKDGLTGIKASFYCGPKRLFDDSKPGPRSSGPIQKCLEDGVKTNAKVRASQSWRLYHPDEVIVVAVLGELLTTNCKAEAGAKLASKICSGAQQDSHLDAHLDKSDKKSSQGEYQGIRTGAGYPRGTPYEIVLRPEDLLEAAGIMERLL